MWLYILEVRAGEQKQKCFQVQLLVCVSAQCLPPSETFYTLHLGIPSSCGTKVKLQALLSVGLGTNLEVVCFPFRYFLVLWWVFF